MTALAIPYNEAEHGHLPIVRTSERTSFGWCRQQWWWNYVEGIRSKEISVPLRFGDLVHQAMEAWYIPGRERGEHPAITFERVYNEADEKFRIRDMDSDEWVGAEELGIDLLNNYVDHYRDEPLIDVISSEMEFRTTVLDKHGNPYCVVVGLIDTVFRNLRTGQICTLEHKTAKSIKTNHLTLDEQASTYWSLAPLFLQSIGLLDEDEDIDTIVYNFIRKAKKDTRPTDDKGRALNKDGSVSKSQPSKIFLRYPMVRGDIDRINAVDRIRKQVWEMEKVRKGELPVYKSMSHRCPQCTHHALCELNEAGADWEEYIKLTYKKVDPYEQYNERNAVVDEEED